MRAAGSASAATHVSSRQRLTGAAPASATCIQCVEGRWAIVPGGCRPTLPWRRVGGQFGVVAAAAVSSHRAFAVDTDHQSDQLHLLQPRPACRRWYQPVGIEETDAVTCVLPSPDNAFWLDIIASASTRSMGPSLSIGGDWRLLLQAGSDVAGPRYHRQFTIAVNNGTKAQLTGVLGMVQQALHAFAIRIGISQPDVTERVVTRQFGYRTLR